LLLEALLETLEEIDDTESNEQYFVRSTYTDFTLLSLTDSGLRLGKNSEGQLLEARYCGVLLIDKYLASSRSLKNKSYRASVVQANIVYDSNSDQISGLSFVGAAPETIFNGFIRTVPLSNNGVSALIIEPHEIAARAMERRFDSHEEFHAAMLKLGADHRSITRPGSTAINAFNIPAAPRSLLIKYKLITEGA
jgi:hypothetical protein